MIIPGTAGAGSLILEFGLLSRLTGDTRFEKAAYKAFFALWNRKSDIGLVGNTINTFTGASLYESRFTRYLMRLHSPGCDLKSPALVLGSTHSLSTLLSGTL